MRTEEDEESASDSGERKAQHRPSPQSTAVHFLRGRRRQFTVLLVVAMTLLMIGVCTNDFGRLKSYVLSLFGMLPFVSPVFMAAWVVVTSHLVHQRFIAFTLVFAVLSHQLPAFITNAIPAIGLIAFGLITRQLELQQKLQENNKKQAQPHYSRTFYNSPPVKAVLSMLIMSTVLLVENFFVWVVSATFYPSHRLATTPPPLQDNGRIIISYLLEDLLGQSKQNVISWRRWLNVQSGLVGTLAAAFITVELQLQKPSTAAAAGTTQQQQQQQRRQVERYPHRSLYTLAQRALLTLALARFIRTISFLLTVLPSQVPNCYSRHFPNPPPADWWSWFQVGLLPNSKGGCNDLVISGHATVTSTLAWISCSVCHHRWFLIALWTMVAMDYAVEVYEGFHYSVDMWLGAILVSLIWHLLHAVEEGDDEFGVEEDVNEQNSRSDSETTTPSSTLRNDTARVSMVEIILYSIPAVFSYLQITVLPQSWVNYGILVYLIAASTRVTRQGFDKYVQHMLFCLLYLALGVYL